jgi:protein-L-isoaspartate(D-aspartate) O-methyltransferase
LAAGFKTLTLPILPIKAGLSSMQDNAPTAARNQMTLQQVRAWSVLTNAELDVFERLRREDFVPDGWQRMAYADMAVPLPEGQHMLRPSVAGRILEAIDLTRKEQVLEIGTGSGYLTACLALLSAQVRSIEIHPTLAAQARINLRNAGVGNATVEEGDAFALTDHAPSYDAIVLTGSLPLYDPRFEGLLRPGGRLFAVVGEGPAMDARLLRLGPTGERGVHSLFETVSDALINAPVEHTFGF